MRRFELEQSLKSSVMGLVESQASQLEHNKVASAEIKP